MFIKMVLSDNTMKLEFYPYDFEYVIKEKVYLSLYSKTTAGKKVCVIFPYQPFFYIDPVGKEINYLKSSLVSFAVEGKPETARIISVDITEKEYFGKNKMFLKAYVNYPKAVPLLAKALEERGLRCYERDILFVQRFLRDNALSPMALTEAEGEYVEKEGLCIPVFRAETMKPVSRDLPQWRILAFDIETYSLKKEIDPEKNPILMAAFYGQDEKGIEFRKVLTWKQFSAAEEYVEFVADEKQLLGRLKEIIAAYQPDIITGYFSDGFDFPYVKLRADKFNLKLDLGVDGSEINTGRKADFREGETIIRGMLHVDVFKFIKNIFGKNMKTDSFSLDAVAHELLGHKKHVVNLDLLGKTWDSEPEKLREYCSYNLHDAYLTQQLCAKLLPDMIEFSHVTGIPVFDVIRMRFSRLVESYILRRAIEYNVIAPNKPTDEQLGERMEESIQGAFVYEPVPGLYKDIVVFDFRSLYPTIISAHNLGPEALRCHCCSETGKVPGKEEYWFCTKEKKFIPRILEQLIELRAEHKRLMKEAKARGEDITILEARSATVKMLANSFYGYLGFYGARWYGLECADATTAYARYYIKSAIEKARAKGFTVIYGDTDSMFMLLGDKNKQDATMFMDEININLPGRMELELEGFYPQGIFVGLKGTERGAKKKYALLSENGTVKIVGFETVRRNWSAVAKEIQEKVLQMVLHNHAEQAVQYVKSMVKELKSGMMAMKKLVIKTQVTRELQDYSAEGPHIAVARRMMQQGEKILPGMVIEYVIVKGTGLVRDRAKIPSEVKEREYDAEYYINNQLIPAVSSIFAVFGFTDEQIFEESSQTGLGKFL